jgi:hypothetical protein
MKNSPNLPEIPGNGQDAPSTYAPYINRVLGDDSDFEPESEESAAILAETAATFAKAMCGTKKL